MRVPSTTIKFTVNSLTLHERVAPVATSNSPSPAIPCTVLSVPSNSNIPAEIVINAVVLKFSARTSVPSPNLVKVPLPSTDEKGW